MKPKTKLLTALAALAMLVVGTHRSYAQGTGDIGVDIDWLEYAENIGDITETSVDDAKSYYLCNVTHDNRYVNAGLTYGTSLMLDNDNMGLRFKVYKNKETYRFQAAINNWHDDVNWNLLGSMSNSQNSYITIDRPADGNVDFTLTPTSTTGTNAGKVFTMQESGYYLVANATSGSSTYGRIETSRWSRNPDEWVLIEASNYFEIIRHAFDGPDQTSVNVSNLVRDGRFIRNADNDNVDGKFWWGYQMPGEGFDGDYQSLPPLVENQGFYLGIDPRNGQKDDAGDSYASDYGRYGSGTVVTGSSGMVRQTIQVETPGTYIVKAKAFYCYISDAGDPDTRPAASDSYVFAQVNGAEVKVLSDAHMARFNELVSTHKSRLGSLAGEYGTAANQFRYNVPAAQLLSEYPDDYTIEIAVTVKGATKKNPVTIGFGVAKRVTNGFVFIDDVELYYQGDYEFGLDAYEKNPADVNIYKDNGFGRRFTLRRKFNIDDWNPLILPVSLDASQVRVAFGDGAKLLKLKGVNTGQSRLLFDPVDLTVGNAPAVDADGFYLVWVTDGPDNDYNDIGDNPDPTGYYFNYVAPSTDGSGGNTIKSSKTFASPFYHFPNVRCEQTLPQTEAAMVSSSDFEVPSGATLTATGYYYRPADGNAGKAGDYIWSGGTLYLLNGDWDTLMGTCWKVRYTNAEGRVMSLDGKFVSTGISNTTADSVLPSSSGVYNLNGQKVSAGTSADGLPSGMYIVNGRKLVVR